jgi:hypothetical protein
LGGDGGGGDGGLGGDVPPGGVSTSLPAQLVIDIGSKTQPALHAPMQSEHTTCGPLTTLALTGQKVPKSGSVKPPELGHVQSFLLPGMS